MTTRSTAAGGSRGRRPRLSSALPVVVLALLAGADIAVGPQRVTLGLVVVAPMLAACLLPRRATAGYAMLALIVAVLLGFYDAQYTPDDWPAQALRLGGVAAGGVIAVWVAAIRIRREMRLREMTAQTLRAEARAEQAELRARFTEVLQRSILRDPPRLDTVGLAVRYQPANSHADVGGDWYDAFEVRDRHILLAVGDVAGHDGEAAALMAQVRSTLRGICQVHPGPPARVLQELDDALRRLDTHVLATIVLAQLERPAEGTGSVSVCWSNAGHPPPILVAASGSARLLERQPDPLIGLRTDRPRQDHVTQLHPGETLVLYTDGLVERRGRSIDDGFAAVLRTATGAAADSVDDMADALMRQVPPTGRTDDVALLAARLRPSRS